MSRAPAYRTDFGLRSHTVFGALGLRPAVAQHSAAEAALLQKWGAGRRMLVEIGVAEGGSAWDVRQVMDAAGTLVLIDTYPRVAGINLSSIIARRLVRGSGQGDVEWIRAYSTEAVKGWTRPIDFLLIDGDHSYDATKRDFEDWSPHMAPGGVIAFHDALLDAPWMSEEFGSAQFVSELRAPGSAWQMVDGADSMAVFRRDGA